MPVKALAFSLALALLVALALLPSRAQHPTEAANGSWSASYYPNTTLSGSAAFTAFLRMIPWVVPRW